MKQAKCSPSPEAVSGFTAELAPLRRSDSMGTASYQFAANGWGETDCVDELRLRHSLSAADLDSVSSLRNHIDLSSHLLIDPDFQSREKKEMNWA